MTTRTEILDRYEDAWRRAALKDGKQLNVNMAAAGPYLSCAWLTVERESSTTASMALLQWLCPACGAYSTTLASVMIHTNNKHGWTWDMLANKFRDWLVEGEILAQQAQP